MRSRSSRQNWKAGYVERQLRHHRARSPRGHRDGRHPNHQRPVSPTSKSSSTTTGPHDPLTANATEPAWNGYLLTVACSCGVVFGRWVTPLDADADLLGIARLN